MDPGNVTMWLFWQIWGLDVNVRHVVLHGIGKSGGLVLYDSEFCESGWNPATEGRGGPRGRTAAGTLHC